MVVKLQAAERERLIRLRETALRELRNRMVHEYLWRYADLHRALMAAHAGVAALDGCAAQLSAKVSAVA